MLTNSPGEQFARRYGARLQGVETLQLGYDLLSRQAVDAVVFDRPRLLVFLQERRDSHMAVSNAEYMRQNYGFALPLGSALAHPMNVSLLQLQESGRRGPNHPGMAGRESGIAPRYGRSLGRPPFSPGPPRQDAARGRGPDVY